MSQVSVTPKDPGAIRRISEIELSPRVRAIDQEAQYPGIVLQKLGQAGAFDSYAASTGLHDLAWSIESMATVGELCLSTAFCMWCQNALRWYISTSKKSEIESRYGQLLAQGQLLGGTGLSNPMKYLTGIEALRLHARRVKGGYRVSGSLPWVSNLGPGHFMACVFDVDDDRDHLVMAVVSCDQEGLELGDDLHFVALNGTGTYSVRMKDVLIRDEDVLAQEAKPFIRHIRAGFILLQVGMAVGLIRSCIESQIEMRSSHGHINRYLSGQPESFSERLNPLETRLNALAATPLDPDHGYFREVLRTRLDFAELSLEVAGASMLHEGARGYLSHGHAQRRLREAYFIAILTPATKQLRKMLEDAG